MSDALDHDVGDLTLMRETEEITGRDAETTGCLGCSKRLSGLAHHPDWHFDKLPDGSTLTRAPDGTEWRRWPDRQRPAQPPPAAAPQPGTTHQPAATLFTHAA